MNTKTKEAPALDEAASFACGIMGFSIEMLAEARTIVEDANSSEYDLKVAKKMISVCIERLHHGRAILNSAIFAEMNKNG